MDNDEEEKKVKVIDDNWDYGGRKKILAPMVRVGTLPFRLYTAQMGADMCYSEELICHKIRNCVRVVDEKLGVVRFEAGSVHAHNTTKQRKTTIFSTLTDRRERVVFQLGAPSAKLALEAAQIVCRDVRAVDLNMGCPKHFSIQGGMGVALLRKPELVKDIVGTLVRNLDIPVTGKIRVDADIQHTLQLAKAIESAGASALAVHARTKDCRPRHEPLYESAHVVCNSVSIPTIYNGDVFVYEDFERLRLATGADSVMVARGAMWNPSIFRPQGNLSIYDMTCGLNDTAIKYGNAWPNTKFILQNMVKAHLTKHARDLTPPFFACKSHEMLRQDILPRFAQVPGLCAPYCYEPTPYVKRLTAKEEEAQKQLSKRVKQKNQLLKKKRKEATAAQEERKGEEEDEQKEEKRRKKTK